MIWYWYQAGIATSAFHGIRRVLYQVYVSASLLTGLHRLLWCSHLYKAIGLCASPRRGWRYWNPVSTKFVYELLQLTGRPADWRLSYANSISSLRPGRHNA